MDGGDNIVLKSCSALADKTCAFHQPNYQHWGCFADTLDRDLPHGSGVTKLGISPAQCSFECAALGYKFSGSQWKGECWCGNEFGKHGQATGCDCDGPNVGAWKQCVYKTGVTEMPTPMPTPAPTEAPTRNCARESFKGCDAWGDPHYTSTFYNAAFNFMGVGLYRLASSTAGDFEVQAFQCKYGGGSAAVFAGFAMKSGTETKTMIGGTTVTRQNNNVVLAQNNQRSVTYTSPDQCYRFVSNMNPSSAIPGHYMNMNIDIASSLASQDGICGDSSGRGDQFLSSEIHTGVDPTASLFTDAELASLCNACQLGTTSTCASRRLQSTGEGEEEPLTPEAACSSNGRNITVAAEKCKDLQGNDRYFEGCVFDYCVTGEDGFVEGAVTALATKQASPSSQTTKDCDTCVAEFDKAGGCAAIHEGQGHDVEKLIPQGCNRNECGEAAMLHCSKNQDCGACVAKIVATGGCVAMREERDPKIPEGCNGCALQATKHCFENA
jgi:hypothetical protein